MAITRSSPSEGPALDYREGRGGRNDPRQREARLCKQFTILPLGAFLPTPRHHGHVGLHDRTVRRYVSRVFRHHTLEHDQACSRPCRSAARFQNGDCLSVIPIVEDEFQQIAIVAAGNGPEEITGDESCATCHAGARQKRLRTVLRVIEIQDVPAQARKTFKQTRERPAEAPAYIQHPGQGAEVLDDDRRAHRFAAAFDHRVLKDGQLLGR